MSIRGLATLATIRDETGDTVTQGQIGKATGSDAGTKASIPGLLGTMVPTGAVAPYSAVVAAIVATIAKPTAKMPHPNQYVPLRWGLLAAMVVLAAASTFISYKKVNSNTVKRKFPWLEITSSLVISAGWGLSMPDNPLTAAINDTALKSIVPLVVGFIALGISALLASALQEPASPS